MKFDLIVKDANASDIAAILAAIGGGTATVIQPRFVGDQSGNTTTTNNDDDDASDTVAPAGTVDKNGLPWDDRIHSTPAKLTTKGEWRARRGVAPQLVASVEAELRARTAAPVQQTQSVVMQQQPPFGAIPGTVPNPVAQQPAPQVDYVPYQQPAPVQMQQPPVVQYQQPAPVQQPVQQPQAQAPQQVDFNGFMQQVQRLLPQRDANGAPLVDPTYLVNVSQRVGQAFGAQVNAITDIMGNQPMIDYAIQLMTSEGRWNWN